MLQMMTRTYLMKLSDKFEEEKHSLATVADGIQTKVSECHYQQEYDGAVLT